MKERLNETSHFSKKEIIAHIFIFIFVELELKGRKEEIGDRREKSRREGENEAASRGVDFLSCCCLFLFPPPLPFNQPIINRT